MIRRIILTAAAAFGIIVLVSPTPATAATTYRVTMTGDSISAMSYGYAAPGGQTAVNNVWRNVEYGRNAYQPGMGGWGTTWSVAKLAIERSQPGGWVVIQDNSLGATDWEWSKLMTDIEALTPDDVCLLGVLPGYLDAAHGGRDDYAALVARHASTMGAIFMRHPCRRFVYLNQYVIAHPTQFPDGQHPDVTAGTWIRNSITAWTG